MPSLCNTTLSSSPDQSQWQYWSSFAERPFSCGDRLQVYKGKLNGRGPRKGNYTVAKVFADLPGTEARCRQELAKFQAGCEWLDRFLTRGKYQPDLVRFAQLQKAPMDQVSCLNKVLSPSSRRPSSGEWVLLEEHIRGSNLARFVDKHGAMYRERAQSAGALSTSDPGPAFRHHSDSDLRSICNAGSGSKSGRAVCSLDTRQVLEAFVHYSHAASKGRLVVCGLEGVADPEGRLLLKTPVIHTTERIFGETDLGPEGVQKVISNHVCNHHCHRVLENSRHRHQHHHQHQHHDRFNNNNNSSTLLSSPAGFDPLPPPYSHSPQPSAPYDPDVFLSGSNPVPVPEGRVLGPAAPAYEEVDLLWGCVDNEHQDVFPPPYSLEGLKIMMLHLENSHPKDPPPPYTQVLM